MESRFSTNRKLSTQTHLEIKLRRVGSMMTVNPDPLRNNYPLTGHGISYKSSKRLEKGDLRLS